jgi:uncharacterized membrane protein
MNPEPVSSAEITRQKRTLIAVIILLIVMAGLVLTVVPKLPLPARIFVAATDLVGAAVLALVLRQKFSGK